MRQTIGIILFLACPNLGAQPITLVKDIAPQQTSPFGPGPQELVTVGSTVFFSAEDVSNGRELWKSDGTPGGTSLLRDILPGRISSVPRWLTDVAGTLYFVAFDGDHGVGLWKSDGTAAGTVLIKGADADFTNPEQLVAAGSRVFLAAFDHAHGLELWTSDGTAAGTVRVKDILPGRIGSLSTEGNAGPYLAGLSGRVYFVADDLTTGRELWTSDGTPAGTQRVKDIRPGPAGSQPSELTLMGSTLFFYADDGATGRELWTSDGTGAGTVLLGDLCPGSCGSDTFGWDRTPGNIAAVGGVLYFKGYSVNNLNTALWRTDGTPAGTILVKDVDLIFPPRLTAAGGRLYFVAGPGGGDAALWTSDGTDPGTLPLAQVAGYDRLTAVGTDLFLLDMDTNFPAGQHLWRSDGTPGGTVLVHSFSYASPVQFSAAVPGALLFVTDDGVTGPALWRSDGTDPGTTLVADPHPGLCALGPGGPYDAGYPCGSSSPRNATNVAGTLYFSTASQEVWRSDGTGAGTFFLTDLSADCDFRSFCPDPTDFTAVGSRLFFRVFRLGLTDGLWTSDGTAAGTVHLLQTGVVLPDRGSLVNLNGTLYFQTYGANPIGLWKSDGTPGGTVPVAPFDHPPGLFDANPESLVVAGAALFITAWDSAHGFELWKSDGTTAGTVLLKDINPGPGDSHPAELAAVGNVVFFSADDGQSGRELWTSDGTVAGTRRMKDIVPGPGSSFPHSLTAAGGSLYFVARDDTHGYEPWMTSDGTGSANTHPFDIRPGRGSSYPEELRAVGSSLLFTANDGISGRELWTTAGTGPSTHRVTDIGPGAASGWISDVVSFGGGKPALFAAYDRDHGREVWATSADLMGASLVQDLAPGPASAEPSSLAVSGPQVFLAAEDGTVGRELWRFDPTPKPQGRKP